VKAWEALFKRALELLDAASSEIFWTKPDFEECVERGSGFLRSLDKPSPRSRRRS
jgi:hypothetical protein